MTQPTAAPVVKATPSIVATIWHGAVHRLGSFVGSIVHTFAKQPQLVEAGVDLALTATGEGEFVPVANTVFTGLGEIMEAAHKWKSANPGQTITTAGIVQNLNFAQSTLNQIDSMVDVLAPHVSAKVDSITKGAQAVTSLATSVLAQTQAAPAASPNS